MTVEIYSLVSAKASNLYRDLIDSRYYQARQLLFLALWLRSFPLQYFGRSSFTVRIYNYCDTVFSCIFWNTDLVNCWMLKMLDEIVYYFCWKKVFVGLPGAASRNMREQLWHTHERLPSVSPKLPHHKSVRFLGNIWESLIPFFRSNTLGMLLSSYGHGHHFTFICDYDLYLSLRLGLLCTK